MNIQPVCSDITLKLAQRISGHAKAPEEALESIFLGAMQHLEKISKTTFDAPMKERVRNAVSAERLTGLKEVFILEFCEKILGDFDENDVSAMLEEHKRTGIITTQKYSQQLQIAFALNQGIIIDAVVNKANSMKDALFPEIVEAVKKEGIKLPEHKS